MKNIKKTFIFLGALVLIIISVCMTLYFTNNSRLNKEAKIISSTSIINTLSKSSELTTAKITFKGVVEYSGEGTSFIDKTEFLMTYEATARAGIDMSNVKVKVDNENKKVIITIPKATIQDVKVDASTIRYYNQKFKLFSLNDKEEANKAQILAEEEAKKEFAKMGVLEFADKQAEDVLKGILSGDIADYELEIIRELD
ncbi:MAG: DUF4230 domain-containing protein [Erysipelotrichaceae bacterium]|nr:DUF4230 domain-containing protein [Erysipelotrichaceae bacterium]